MKITDKIITSTIEPQLKHVMWHNPETGELKMFGNKGWEIAGGSAGSSNDDDSNTNGYPVVEVPLKEFTFDINPDPEYAHTDNYYDISDLKPNIYYKISYNEATGVGYDTYMNVSINPFSQLPKGSKMCYVKFPDSPPIYDSTLEDQINWDAARQAYSNFSYLCALIPSKKEGCAWDLIPYCDKTHNINSFENLPKIGDKIQLTDIVSGEIADIVISDTIVWDAYYSYWWLIEDNIILTETYYGKTYNVYKAFCLDEGVVYNIYTTETISNKSADFVFYYDLLFNDDNDITLWLNGIGTVYSLNEELLNTNIKEYIIEAPSYTSLYTNMPLSYNNDTYPDREAYPPQRIVTSIVDGVACFTSTPYPSQYSDD